METYQQISSSAKEKVKSSPKEAFDLYKRLWEEFPDEFNDWDGMFMMQAAKFANYRIYGDLIPVVDKFKEEDKVTGNYCWYVFDLFVKRRKNEPSKVYDERIKGNEKQILSLINRSLQKDKSEENNKDPYLCPYTNSILSLLKVYKKQAAFPANKIIHLLSEISPEKLSKQCNSYTDNKGKETEEASPLEAYYAGLSKAYDKSNQFENCIKTSQKALSVIDNYHYDYDIWFQYRIAKSELELGNLKKAQELFEELINTRLGASKAFLFKEIAEIYFERNDYELANNYSLKGLMIQDKLKNNKNLYLLQARLFFRLNKKENVPVIANVLNSYYAEDEEAGKIPEETTRLLQYSNLSPKEPMKLFDALREARELIASELYAEKPLMNGKIIKVNFKGNAGHIESVSGKRYGFRKQNFKVGQKDLKRLNGAKVAFYETEDFEGKPIADVIVIEEMPKSKGSSAGKRMKGKINNVSDLGIFLDFKSGEKGLVHKSKLPNNFSSKYSKGSLLSVRVIKKTDKGLDLSLDE